MRPNHVLVFGGTSDALSLCAALEERDIRFTLSVATEEGKHSARRFADNIVLGRMDSSQMRDFITSNGVDYVIDAAHPYAQALRLTIVVACASIQCPVMRYERPSPMNAVSSPFLIKAQNVMDACRKVTEDKKKVLLTTGSKDLESFKRILRDKFIVARVLPVASVIAECNNLGLGIDNIIAMKGPFSKQMNLAMYEMIQPDVVITKESGHEGGFIEKVEPCIELGITCIVIERPQTTSIHQYQSYQTDLTACAEWFDRWQQEASVV